MVAREGFVARIARSRYSLMIVGVNDNADPVSHIEGIMQDPFEGAPGRMNFNRTFDDAIMG